MWGDLKKKNTTSIWIFYLHHGNEIKPQLLFSFNFTWLWTCYKFKINFGVTKCFKKRKVVHIFNLIFFMKENKGNFFLICTTQFFIAKNKNSNNANNTIGLNYGSKTKASQVFF